MKLRRGSILVATAVIAGIALTGCGSDSLDSGPKKSDATAQLDTAAAALVPQAIKDKGKLVIGTDASYAPNEFLSGDGKTIEGMDIDLFNAVATTLGLTTEFKPASFDGIITGVLANKYDMGISSFTINADRLKQVTMTSYFNAGTQWAAAPGNPDSVDPAKPCGLTVAVQKGTTQQEDDLPAKIAACKSAGTPIKVLVYDRQDQATAAVASGKAQAMLADSPVVAYAVKQSGGKMESVGDIYDSAPYGYVLPKADTAFGDAIVAALKVLESSGVYTQILNDWGVTDGAISDFAVNPAP